MPTFTLLILGLSVLLALLIGWATWRQRPDPGTRAFSIGMGGLAWLLTSMVIANGAVSIFEAPDVAYVFFRLKWFGTNVMALGWFFFTLAYTGRKEYITRRVIAVATSLPALSAALVITSDRFLEIVSAAIGFSVALPTFDLWLAWEGVAIAYIYALILAGSLLLVGMILAHRMPHPELAGIWVLAISIPWAVNVSYLSGILSPLGRPDISVDPTPLAFLLTGLVGLAAITRYDSFEKAPVARTYVVDELRAGVLVYDEECRILDLNDWVSAVLDLPTDVVGRDVRQVFGDWFDLGAADGDSPPDAAEVARRLQDREIEIERNGGSTHLSVEVSPLSGPRGLPMGYSVLWYDVTAQKRSQRELEASNERLAYERDLKERIRDTLINVSTRSELERAFCESAVGEERVLAWVGEKSPQDGVSIRTGANSGRSLDDVVEYSETTPLADRALRTGETTVENDLGALEAEWAGDALEAGMESGIAIPLDHNELNYGVFCVFANDRNAFGDRERSLLEETAESFAFSIHAATQRESLRSEEPMRVVFDVRDEANYLWPIANGAIPSDGSIEVREVGDGEDDDAIQILTATNVEPDAIFEAISSHDAVLSVESIGGPNGTDAIRARVELPTVESEIADLGGAVRSTTVSDGRVRVLSEFSRRADLEEVLARLREHFPDTELASRVYAERSDEIPPDPSPNLTEKQLNALRTAYVSGFFHRPQRATADDVADALGVSRTTFLHHLRAAERGLFEGMFDQ